VRAAALRRGVILRPGADLIVICPPLIVTRAQIDLIVRVLGEAITEVASELAGADRPRRSS
jgi:adenosylmethionine-8-amino-7-oxononanoate aminotransferase